MKELLENPIVQEVFNIFEGKEIYVVGGAVRDTLLDREIHDIDFATNLLPDDIEKLAKSKGYKTTGVGKSFGTIVIRIYNQNVEVTTYRKKEAYKANSRKPEVVYGSIIEEDLQRRDFTINAMAWNNTSIKNFVDPFRGNTDLAKGLLRTPQDSRRTFKEDPLRMLRAIRFVSKYGFDIEEQTYKGIVNNAHKILTVSKERIKAELDKILVGPYVEKALDLLKYSKLINYIIPELTVLYAVSQNEEYHHKDVWGHTLLVVKGSPNNSVNRWAALLHDIGKPYVKTCDKKGIHFYNHEVLGAEIAKSILYRFKFPKDDEHKILFLIQNHMRPNLYNKRWTDASIRRFKKDMGNYLNDSIALSRADITGKNSERKQKALDNLKELEERCNKKEAIIPECPLSGEDIMRELNVGPGRHIGYIKEAIMKELEEDPEIFDNDDSILIFANKVLNDWRKL